MRVFLDANILFSAAKSDGAVRELLNDLRKAKQTLVADAYVVEEARRNIDKKFPEATKALEKLLKQIELSAKASSHHNLKLPTDLPAKDRPVLAAAICLKCDILLTGNKAHFGKLYGKTVEGVKVLSPVMLASL